MFSIQIEGGKPIYEQLFIRISELIMNGIMQENEKLPAVREVAKSLGINPNTVQKTYAMLEAEGLIYSIPAKGSYIAKAEKTAEKIREMARAELKNAVNTAFSKGITADEATAIVKLCEEERK